MAVSSFVMRRECIRGSCCARRYRWTWPVSRFKVGKETRGLHDFFPPLHEAHHIFIRRQISFSERTQRCAWLCDSFFRLRRRDDDICFSVGKGNLDLDYSRLIALTNVTPLDPPSSLRVQDNRAYIGKTPFVQPLFAKSTTNTYTIAGGVTLNQMTRNSQTILQMVEPKAVSIYCGIKRSSLWY